MTIDSGHIRRAGQDVRASWRGLAEFYLGPDSATLLAAMVPVVAGTEAFGADLAIVGRALQNYADEVRPIAGTLVSLRRQAEAFEGRTSKDAEWNHDQANVDENNRLVHGVNAAVVLLEAAERRCANAIEALFSCRRWHANDGGQDCDSYGYAIIPDSAPTPWGSKVSRKDSCPKAALTDLGRFAKGFAVDGFVGTLSGVAGLLNPFDWAKFKSSWEGLAQLSLVASPILGSAIYGDHGERDRLASLGKGVVAYDLWRTDPSRAAGGAAFNVASLLAPGAGEASAAADAAKVARIAGEATDSAESVGKAARSADIAADLARTAVRLTVDPLSATKFVSLPTLDQLTDLMMARRAAQLGMKVPTTAELTALMEKLAHAKPGELTVSHSHLEVPAHEPPAHVPDEGGRGSPEAGGHQAGDSSPAAAGDARDFHPALPSAIDHEISTRHVGAPDSQMLGQQDRISDVDFGALPNDEKAHVAKLELQQGAAHLDSDTTAAAYGREHWDEYVKSLSPAEKRALAFYTHQPPHRLTSVDINAALRGLERPKEGVDASIHEIDRALQGTEVHEPIVVTRGMRLGHLPAEPADLVGKLVTDRGYTSVSLGTPAFGFAEGILHLRLPVGTHGIYVDRLSAFSGEREMILERGLSYRVTRTFLDDNNQWQIFGEVLGNG
ncbi:ADP-ribosyltransferase [Jatrophihabitans sp. GAS493]|uniref:ADP-ribosyltransferase n=1 Tax=Jatrophihabitans sp. GAS493 TaxID=1907575 RepID=UPI0012FE6F54|nr:ADP-ribosyltransferase [Jatrophihabitans sp. GAS493]